MICIKKTSLVILVFATAFTACKKDNRIAIIESPRPTFSVKETLYSLEGSDSLTAVTHEITQQTFNNFIQITLEVKDQENYRELLMSSQFEFNISLSAGVDLSKLEVSVPRTIVADKIYSGDNKWPISKEKKQKPFITNMGSWTSIKIPTKSEVTVFC